jgi:hypothetical protein
VITDAIFTFFATILLWPLTLLPAWDPLDLSGPTAAIASLDVGSWLGWVNQYLPVTQGVVALGLILVVSNATWLTNWVIWLLTKAHILGGQ